MQLRRVRLRKGHVGQHGVLGLVHDRCELGQLGAHLAGDLVPLRLRRGDVGLGEGGVLKLRDRAPHLLAGVGYQIADEVNPTALPGDAEDLGDGCIQALVRVRDHQLHALQSPPAQLAQELQPERLRLLQASVHAEHLLASGQRLHVHGGRRR